LHQKSAILPIDNYAFITKPKHSFLLSQHKAILTIATKKNRPLLYIKNLLIGTAIGDAFGTGVSFQDRDFEQR